MKKKEYVPDRQVKQAWADEWRSNDDIEDSASHLGRYLRHKRLKITRKLLKKIKLWLGDDGKVIDAGCGSGKTLDLIREVGLNNSIGIDFTKEALRHCQNKGYKINEDVYLLDAKNTGYPDQCFNVYFSEGLWEHFSDPEPYIKEACRITSNYILVIQPDHYSFFGKLIHWAWMRLDGGGVEEYSFPISYFIETLQRYEFKLLDYRHTWLNEQAILLFVRTEN